MNIFVAKLNFKTTSDDLRSLFEQFGEVESAQVIMDKETGKSRGFGFVEMKADEEANAAIQGLDGTEFQTRTIACKEAAPRESRPSGGGYNRGGGGNYGGGGGYGGGGYDRDRGNGGGGYDRDNGYNRR